MAFLSAPIPLTTRQSTRQPATIPCAPARAPRMATAVPSPSPAKRFTRRVFLTALASATGSLVAATISTAETSPTPTDSNLQYSVVKRGNGPMVEIGDLVGIRFKGAYNGVVFDNLFEEPRPYFFRAGSGTILKGIEQAVMLMSVGDVYELTSPGDLAFGAKGRRASPGKPSIPPNATVNYTLELTTIPGKDEELLEITDDQPDL